MRLIRNDPATFFCEAASWPGRFHEEPARCICMQYVKRGTQAHPQPYQGVHRFITLGVNHERKVTGHVQLRQP